MYVDEIHNEELKKLELGSVFNSEEWISIYEPVKLILMGVFNKNKELIGTFYYYKHKRAKLLTHVSSPFLSPHCGLWLKDETTNPANKNSFYKKVFEVIGNFLMKEKFDILTFPFPSKFMDMQPFVWIGFQIKPRYTYQLDLRKTEEELLAAMSSERRKNISKSQKENLIVKESFENTSSQNLIENTFVKQGMWYDKSVLKNIFLNFRNTENAITYSTYDGDKLLSTVFCIRDKEITYYILGGNNSESNHSGAGAFAMWYAIKKAKELGCSIFDFEGSMHPPIEKYFRGFGGEMIPYFSLEKSNLKGKALLKLRGK